MAEQIPFNIIADVLTKLGSSAVQQIGSAFGVTKELANLTEKLERIRDVLLDAEEKQEKSHVAWVRRLKDVVYDADDLLDDFATHQLQRGGVARQVSDFFSSSNQLVFRFEMSNRVKNIKEAVDEIVKEISPMLNVIQGNIVHSGVEGIGREPRIGREPHSYVFTSKIVGREQDKEEIIESLVSSDNQGILSMVAIVGIGGLGKTTLAQLVYNDEKVASHFELRIWVCVSVGFDVRSLVKRILESVTNERVEGLDLFDLKDKLQEKLTRRRYLLVLDDVWDVRTDQWEDLRSLLIVGSEGSKILVTTRNRKVAEYMGDHSLFDLKPMEKDESWDLFLNIAFKEGEEEMFPNLTNIGKKIVNLCNGVPLLVKSLASILRFSRQEGDWLVILHNENLLEFEHGNENVLRALKLSYSNLPTCLKQCFTYCALFPKDYEIERKSLVQLWMAQGYIQSSNDNNEQLEDVGGQYFDELFSRLFFEEERHAYNSKIYYKMHKLMHDLAQSIIASDVPRAIDDGRFEIQKALHVFLSPQVNPMINASQKISLRTFFMVNEDGLEDDSKDDSNMNTIISSSKRLRALSLNKFNMKKVPKFLSKLSHLRYLDLSNNDFKVLPSSIARLKHLQTLKVIDCVNLKEFPKDTRELFFLRHLENDGCANLTHMPCGIGELTSLQSLPIFVVGNRKRVLKGS